MKRLWIESKALLGSALEWKHLPLTLLAVLCLVSLLSRVILMLR